MPSRIRLSPNSTSPWGSRFAHDGDPNGGEAAGWPPYRASSGRVLSPAPGQDGIAEVDLAREHRCDFWKSLS